MTASLENPPDHIIVYAVDPLGTVDDDDLPTGEVINEWIRESRKEGVCGIVGLL